MSAVPPPPPVAASGRPLPLVALAGPTASGKSALSLVLVDALAAQGIGTEIVSVDSAQIYRGLDIGTAKPDAATRARVPHHLLDLLDPAETYSAARFAEDATAAIAAIRGRGHVPLLVGGTMLYFRALLRGLSALPAADSDVRARLSAEAERWGWPALHARLAAVDAETAAQLHPNDAQRVQRALEVHALTGMPASALRTGGGAPSLAPLHCYALWPEDRAALHEAIKQRLLRMMDAGLLDEVRALHARGDLHAGLPAVRAVGYRQLWAHVEGAVDYDTAVGQAVAATRQYAKRQITWLRSEFSFRRLDPAEPGLAAEVLRDLKASMGDAM